MLESVKPDIVITTRWHTVSYYVQGIYLDKTEYQTVLIDCQRTVVPRIWPGREVREHCHLLFEGRSGGAWSTYVMRFGRWERQNSLPLSLQTRLSNMALTECMAHMSDLTKQIKSLTNTPE